MRTDCTQAKARRAEGGRPARGGRVLLVEPEKEARAVYHRQLEEAGYAVEAVAGGADALERIGCAPSVNVLIVAIRLADMSGLTVMRKALGRDPELAIVIHSASPAYKGDFATWCAEDYVVKSTDPRTLPRAVRQVLERRRAESEIAS